MITTTIYLVRHGETEWNKVGRRQGHLDSSLTEKGVQQAYAVGRLLATSLPEGVPFVVETSPLDRTRQTANIICTELGTSVPSIVEPLLIEHDLGLWQGLTYAEIEERFPGAQAERNRNKWHFQMPDGEGYSLISLRAHKWIAIDREVPIRIGVTHEMLSRTIQGAYMDLSPSETLNRSHPQTTVFRMSEGEIENLTA